MYDNLSYNYNNLTPTSTAKAKKKGNNDESESEKMYDKLKHYETKTTTTMYYVNIMVSNTKNSNIFSVN